MDPARLKDPDVAAEAERPRLTAIAAKYSREDLLRAFDAFTRAEQDVKQSDYPRFQLEMALVRLMHLRKLVPLADLLDGGGRPAMAASRPASSPARPSMPATRPPAAAARPAPAAPPSSRPATAATTPSAAAPSAPAGGSGDLRDRFLAAVKAGKPFFFNAVVAQAYRIEVAAERITFAFLANQKVPRAQCEENREWLSALAVQVLGQPAPVHVTVVTPESGATAAPPAAPAAAAPPPAPPARPSDDELRQEALADPGVQALFEIFPVERTKIEEM